MLPFYVVFDLVLGATWTFQSPNRTNAGLNAIRAIWPVATTGMILIGLALLMATALLIHSRALESMLLACQMVTFAGLGIIFMKPLQLALTWHPWPELHVGSPTVSMSGSYWPFFVAVAAFASFTTVISDEQTFFGERR